MSEAGFFRKVVRKYRFFPTNFRSTLNASSSPCHRLFKMEETLFPGVHMLRSTRLLTLLIALSIWTAGVAQECVCKTCRNPAGQRGPEWTRYWQDLRQAIRKNQTTTHPRNLLGPTQVVFLDFDTGKDSTFIYTPLQRDQIQANMEQIYDGFDVTFTQTLPAGDFSTIVFNSGSIGGLAEGIDFRNLDRNDSAVMNADGLGLNPEQIVVFSSNIASHELGHLLGLRHGDSFGPIGEGVLPPFASFFDPPYPGPQVASESFDHIMATPGLGAPLNVFFESLNWFSERSSAKIGFAEDGLAVDDVEPNDSIAAAQPLQFQTLVVPNNIQIGENAGLDDFSLSATTVAASLDGQVDGQDIFRFDAKAGDLFTIEVISNSVNRLAVDPIDPNVSAFDTNGKFIDYYGTAAFNEREFESTLDCNLIDFLIQQDGPVFLQVDNTFPNDAGQYELWIYRLNGIHGDVNCDSVIDLLDVQPFVDLLTAGEFNPKADINLDGTVNLLDVSPFVALLIGD